MVVNWVSGMGDLLYFSEVGRYDRKVKPSGRLRNSRPLDI